MNVFKPAETSIPNHDISAYVDVEGEWSPGNRPELPMILGMKGFEYQVFANRQTVTIYFDTMENARAAYDFIRFFVGARMVE